MNEPQHEDPRRVVVAYHQRTKHHHGRFARSLGYLDWANQPNPFRRFEGAALLALDRSERPADWPAYDDLYAPGRIAPQPADLASVSSLLYHSMALSAWKQHGPSRWALRVNPSSGNLHPTEAYLILGAAPGLSARPGLYHYAPREHGLEHRADVEHGTWSALSAALGPGSFLVALTTISWRESWKYGERAFRYCQHDVGHALAALRLAAALQGWRLAVLPGAADASLERLLGLGREDASHEHEREVPDLLVAVRPASDPLDDAAFRRAAGSLAKLDVGPWFGHANRLSGEHHPWPVLDEVERACRAPEGWRLGTPAPPADTPGGAVPSPAGPRCPHTAARVIRQRRSAQAMDGRTPLARDRLYAMLARLVPALCPVPWDALGPPVLAHLGLFVHRVEGLDPGLYLLIRDPLEEPGLRAAIRPDAVWRRPPGCPQALALYLLRAGDVQSLAARVSCDQELAGDGAFSAGMLVAFDRALDWWGAPVYRRLFWETGMIGQVLYLEAEAAGLRGTGIGCFYDDPVHAVFGLADTRYQSFYHFTVGGPVDDPRLVDLPAYAHLDADR